MWTLTEREIALRHTVMAGSYTKLPKIINNIF